MKLLFAGVIACLFALPSGNAGAARKNISEYLCDAQHPCPGGWSCYLFPGDEDPVCARVDPCSYYRCSETYSCVVGKTYPHKVTCVPESGSGPVQPESEKELPAQRGSEQRIRIEVRDDYGVRRSPGFSGKERGSFISEEPEVPGVNKFILYDEQDQE
ncbi:MAG: hypothetical protein GF333_06775 [Candidatus Omnitrophica bacterium]|nr:hypothetical protein [Candidatus Omnitrophota bacterium]